MRVPTNANPHFGTLLHNPLYDGMTRAEAARVGGMDRQTLRDRVHRFNRHGPDGLMDGKAPGASPKLTASRLEELAAVVETGPILCPMASCAGGAWI